MEIAHRRPVGPFVFYVVATLLGLFGAIPHGPGGALLGSGVPGWRHDVQRDGGGPQPRLGA